MDMIIGTTIIIYKYIQQFLSLLQLISKHLFYKCYPKDITRKINY